MPGLIRSAICYEYTFPFGMINYLISPLYDFCSDDIDIKGKCEDVENCDDLNQSIANLLHSDENIITSNEISNQEIIVGYDPIHDQERISEVYGLNPVNTELHERWKTQLPDSSTGAGLKDKNGHYLFGCIPSITQATTQSFSATKDISYDTARDMVNHVNSAINEHQENLGIPHSDIYNSHRNQTDNQTLLITKVTQDTKEIITQSQNVAQKIIYIDNYGKCGPKGVSTHILQEITMNDIAKNIIQSTLKQMMKNDDTLKITSTMKITNVSDRMIFFSLLISILMIYTTYKIFKGKELKMALLIYFSFIIFSFILLYVSKETKSSQSDKTQPPPPAWVKRVTDNLRAPDTTEEQRNKDRQLLTVAGYLQASPGGVPDLT